MIINNRHLIHVSSAIIGGLYSDFHSFVQPNPYPYPYPNLNQFLPNLNHWYISVCFVCDYRVSGL